MEPSGCAIANLFLVVKGMASGLSAVHCMSLLSVWHLCHVLIISLGSFQYYKICFNSLSIGSGQEIIKVREWISHIGHLTKVIRLKLFLDIVPSSSAEITRALRGCFREGFVYMYVVSFCFISKRRKTSNAVAMSFIFWLQPMELRLSVCFNTSRNFNWSLNGRRMSPAQTITTEWKAEKCSDKRQTTNKRPKHKLGNRTNRWSKVQADARFPSCKKKIYFPK